VCLESELARTIVRFGLQSWVTLASPLPHSKCNAFDYGELPIHVCARFYPASSNLVSTPRASTGIHSSAQGISTRIRSPF
jgi:hypothetical protein